MTETQIDILTVCTGNICRSPMAEGLLRTLLSAFPGNKISSAGTHAVAGRLAEDFAVIAAHEHGIDISAHRARMIEKEMIFKSGIILCMESSQVEEILEMDVSAESKTFDLSRFSDGGRLKRISDPYGCSLRQYRECFKDIHVCIRNFLSSEYFQAEKRRSYGSHPA